MKWIYNSLLELGDSVPTPSYTTLSKTVYCGGTVALWNTTIELMKDVLFGISDYACPELDDPVLFCYLHTAFSLYSHAFFSLQSDLRKRGAFGVPTSIDRNHLSFCNICGLNSNLDSIQLLLPSILFLTEIGFTDLGISLKSLTKHLLYPGYELLTLGIHIPFRIHLRLIPLKFIHPSPFCSWDGLELGRF